MERWRKSLNEGHILTSEMDGQVLYYINSIESERDKLKAELERVSGKTQFCILCEQTAKENDKLKMELEHIRFITGRSGCEIVDRLESLDRWREMAGKLARSLERISFSKPDRLSHQLDVLIIERAAKLAKQAFDIYAAMEKGETK